MGIPFAYEQPTTIYHAGRHAIWFPDFTLVDRDDLLIEYAGLIANPEYARRLAGKLDIYADNGRRCLVVTPADIQGPAWPRQLLERIIATSGSHPAR